MAIFLKNTRVDDIRTDGGPASAARQYYGCGLATLALLEGEPVGLVYDEPQVGAPTGFPKHDETRRGMVSCWEFCG